MSNDEFVGLFLGALAMLGLLIFFLNRPSDSSSIFSHFKYYVFYIITFRFVRDLFLKDYKYLLRCVLKDKAKAERLIQFEIDRMKPNPISRNEAIKRAIYRINRDNRYHNVY